MKASYKYLVTDQQETIDQTYERRAKVEQIIKIPTRSRSFDFLDSYREFASKDGKTAIVLTLDNNDNKAQESVNSSGNYGSLQLETLAIFGNSKSKIDAFNRDFELIKDVYPNWKVLVASSDDMIPFEKDYDRIIREKLLEFYPDTYGCLWLRTDGATDRRDRDCPRGLCTLSIMGRAYYEYFGYVYHPSYKSLFCDNEFTEIGINSSKLRRYRSKKEDDGSLELIKHDHPAWEGSRPYDSLHSRDFSLWKQDEQNFWRRHAASRGFCNISQIIKP